MVNAELRRLQMIELEILKEFLAICDKLQLRYYIIAGTLLGAARHKGFIPWDDDIDVAMPREDYETFRKKARELLPPRYFLQDLYIEEEYYLNIIKIRDLNTTFIEKPSREQNLHHGVFIDVFPLDYWPESKRTQLWFRVQRKAYKARIFMKFLFDNKKNPVKELLKKPLILIWPDVKKAVLSREKLYRSFPKSDMLINYSGVYGDREVTPAEWYGEGCDLEFEGLTVKAPKEYQKWLTQIYGDYMQLPPVEERVGHHNATVIDLDHPYTEYIK